MRKKGREESQKEKKEKRINVIFNKRSIIRSGTIQLVDRSNRAVCLLFYFVIVIVVICYFVIGKFKKKKKKKKKGGV